MAAGQGRADYLLYVDQLVDGVIEAKPEGTPLSGVEWQSAMYADGLPADVKLAALTKDGRIPFVFEASGTETHFNNGFDPEPRARRIFNFPKAATLAKTLRSKDEEHPTWRGKVTAMPELATKPLRPAQIEAINGVDDRVKAHLTNRRAGRGSSSCPNSWRTFAGFQRNCSASDAAVTPRCSASSWAAFSMEGTSPSYCRIGRRSCGDCASRTYARRAVLSEMMPSSWLR